MSDPAGQTTRYAYDAQNHITVVTDPRGTQMVQNTYDASGQVTQQLHGDGSQTLLAYPSDTARQVTDGNGHVQEHDFESHGLLSGIKTPLNQNYTTAYSPALFDTSGGLRSITTTDPQGRQMVTELNNFNQPVKITDAAGQITTLSYEPNFQQLASITDPLSRLTRFAYDATGNLTAATDPDGNQSTFTYNAQGQVLTATNALGQTVKYQYNSNHDLVQVTDALGNNTSFTYDNLSRLTQVTDAKGNKTQYAYDLLNRVTSITDALGHVTKLAYDENGNLISVRDPKGHVTTASYDPMNRLISTTNAKGETVSLNYDGAGNVVSTTDAKGQTQQFTYDANDRKTQMQAADGTTYKYTYDNVNRLTGINDGVNTWSFAYDPLGRRTSYTIASTLKTYLLNGLDVLSDGSSNFLHGVGVDEHLQVSTSTGSMSYLQDHLGSTSQLLDSNNSLSKARLDYKSYGKLEGDGSNPVSANPYTYTGREDDGTGLYYYRNRYYDPELEIFVSQDPLGDAQRYVSGNPIRFIDPLGLYKLNLIDKTDFDSRYLQVAQNKAPQLGGETVNIKWTTVGRILKGIIGQHNGELPSELNVIAHGGPNHLGGMFNPAGFAPLHGNSPITITLYSCNTGYGSDSIAQQLSSLLPNGNSVCSKC